VKSLKQTLTGKIEGNLSKSFTMFYPVGKIEFGVRARGIQSPSFSFKKPLPLGGELN